MNSGTEVGTKRELQVSQNFIEPSVVAQYSGSGPEWVWGGWGGDQHRDQNHQH